MGSTKPSNLNKSLPTVRCRWDQETAATGVNGFEQTNKVELIDVCSRMQARQELFRNFLVPPEPRPVIHSSASETRIARDASCSPDRPDPQAVSHHNFNTSTTCIPPFNLHYLRSLQREAFLRSTEWPLLPFLQVQSLRRKLFIGSSISRSSAESAQPCAAKRGPLAQYSRSGVFVGGSLSWKSFRRVPGLDKMLLLSMILILTACVDLDVPAS